jgi:hypothetical protein
VGGAPWAPYLSSLKKKEKGKKINVLSRIDAGRKNRRRRRDFGEEISQERRRQKMWPAVA